MNAYDTARVRRICKQYDVPTYSDETGEQIADRIDQLIQRHQAALDHIRQGESSYPGDAADIDSMWECERCLALLPCERHDDDGSTNERTNQKETTMNTHPDPVDLLSDDWRTLVETANLDWQVNQYVYFTGKAHEHSANEIKAAAIASIARRQHGDEFDKAVARY